MKRAILDIVIGAIVLGSLIFLGQYLYIREVEVVEAQVIDKVYTESYITNPIIMLGRMPVSSPTTHPESFIIKVKYKEMESSIDDKTLYETVEIGDSVKVEVVKVYTREGLLKNEYIR